MSFVKPEKIIESINFHAGMKAADFGCGAGFYTIPLAKKAGEKGKVYAIDIRKEMLELIASKAKNEHLLNIETIWGDLEENEGSHLADELINVVIISNILFQAEDKSAVVKEAKRILKPEGIAVVVEWDKEKGPTGSQDKQKLDQSQVKDLFLKHGFSSEKQFYAGEHHYGIIFKKNTS